MLLQPTQWSLRVSLGLCKGMKAVHSCSRLAAERRGGASHAVGFVPHG